MFVIFRNLLKQKRKFILLGLNLCSAFSFTLDVTKILTLSQDAESASWMDIFFPTFSNDFSDEMIFLLLSFYIKCLLFFLLHISYFLLTPSTSICAYFSFFKLSPCSFLIYAVNLPIECYYSAYIGYVSYLIKTRT